MYFWFLIFNSNKPFAFNGTFILLLFHVVPTTSGTVIILWDGLFYSLLIQSLCVLLAVVSTTYTSRLSLNLRTQSCFCAGNWWQWLADEFPWYNHNQCRLFSHEIKRHL